jgi:sortase A
VEIVAVAGLIFILYNGVSLIRELNQEVSTVLEQPTLTPTALITAIVLPSGHTSPTSPLGAQPNEAEIPEHLRPLVQSLADIPLPTPGPEQAIRIQIPTIGVDAPIVQGDGWEQLKKGVGQHVSTANPGETGNIVLSAHNDIFGEIFRHLDQLQPGDAVAIFTNQRTYSYIVTGKKIVEPTQTEVMESTNQPTMTLISCYPYLIDNKRIVITGRLQSGNP